MAFFNDFKELFTNAAQSVTNKTRDGVETARIAGECRAVANDLADLYEKIGRAYVDSRGGDAETLNALCARALELREKLEILDRQRMQLRNQSRCPACGAPSAKEARFCANCGRRLPEDAPQPEPAPAAEDAEYCPECGAMRKAGDKFCPLCGHGSEAPAESEPEDKPEVFEVKLVRPKPPVSQDDSDEAPADFEAD